MTTNLRPYRQLAAGSDTFVFLYSRDGGTWRTRLLDITTDTSEVDHDLVPNYYEPSESHRLWVSEPSRVSCTLGVL
jgi:hypothetical protein